jgi:hypothetical protein
MNDQYTPLLVYCSAIGLLPPLASRPARTALLSPVHCTPSCNKVGLQACQGGSRAWNAKGRNRDRRHVGPSLQQQSARLLNTQCPHFISPHANGAHCPTTLKPLLCGTMPLGLATTLVYLPKYMGLKVTLNKSGDVHSGSADQETTPTLPASVHTKVPYQWSTTTLCGPCIACLRRIATPPP